MSDAAVTSAAPAKAAASKKKTGSSKAKKPADHPKYSAMIKDAVAALKERGGSSRQAILKYIIKHNKLPHDEKTVNAHLKMALRAGVKNGSLKQSKGTGATGSFRIGDAVKSKPAKKTKAAGAKKPKVAKKPKTTGAKKAKSPKKKTSAGKVKKPKVAKKAKSTTKTAKPKASSAAKPKKAKTAKAKPAKKVAAKK